MLSLLATDWHGERLCELLDRYRREEAELNGLLEDLQVELDVANLAASRERLAGGDGRTHLARCIELQAACDGLAIELAHVRLAVVGARDELTLHEHGRQHTAAV